ncbi:MAG: glycosyltransferase family 4 protein [Bdellovibrionales bacterium]|nr:glycosyltransferase family 4 protein [Bdellovibrionales bacterium]
MSSEIRAIHQIVPAMNYGDAVANTALVLQECFREWGVASEIFCHVWSKELKARFLNLEDILDDNQSLFLYHHCTGGTAAFEHFSKLKSRKAMLFQNITPPKFFENWSDDSAQHSATGLREIDMLRSVIEFALVPSSFNESVLFEHNIHRTYHIPLVFQESHLQSRFSLPILQKIYSEDAFNILTVGRLAPNKKIEDILDSFALLQKKSAKPVRLFIVGSRAGYERYSAFLLQKTIELQISDCLFLGKVPQDELAAYYQLADCYLCLSEHEGFCVPLVEAMYSKVPIVAFSAGAIPETLGNSGVLLEEKSPETVSNSILQISEDSSFRESLIQKQSAELPRFSIDALKTSLQTKRDLFFGGTCHVR